MYKLIGHGLTFSKIYKRRLIICIINVLFYYKLLNRKERRGNALATSSYTTQGSISRKDFWVVHMDMLLPNWTIISQEVMSLKLVLDPNESIQPDES